MEELIAVVNRVARSALAKYDGVPWVDDIRWTVELRAAFVDAANAGKFAAWGVTDGIQLQSLPYKAGVDGNNKLFVLNPDKIAKHIREIAGSVGL